MTLYFASDAPLSSTAQLPWGIQLAIGIALLLGAAGLHELDERIDSDFLGFAAFFVGLGGLAVVVSALQ